MRWSVFFLILGALPIPSAPSGTDSILPENSLYHLESSWERDDGKTMKLTDLRGQVRIFSMFFSRCKDICPMMLGQLKMLERDMPADLVGKIGFVLVTLDAAADTLRTLANYRREVNLPPERWTLLRGSQDDTRELAHVLGVAYTPKKNDGQIDHTGLIAVLDAEGRIVEKVSGIKDRQAFIQRLRVAVARSLN